MTADKNSEKLQENTDKNSEKLQETTEQKSNKLRKRPSKTARRTSEEMTRTNAASRLLDTMVYLAYRKFSVYSTLAVR